MIPLRLLVDPLPIDEPLITRLTRDGGGDSPFDALYRGSDGDMLEYDLCGFPLRLQALSAEELDGDVLLILPGQRSAHRLIRARSPHNTFLVTERCDQLCVMCSQPPKKHHADLFPSFRQAALLAPHGIYIGLSGGEPMLFKQEVFRFLEETLAARPDLRFHILTNGQHFEPEDEEVLRRIPKDRVLWGIPLYSADPVLHDTTVAKAGAYARLMKSFSILARAGAAVELRTVVMKTNADDLGKLARLVATRLPFISVWALMQLESIGYGRMNWDALFLDTSIVFDAVAEALDTVHARGIDAQLYNFPACTVPQGYRRHAPATISDWKRRYLQACEGCAIRDACTGFFEWYPDNRGFGRISPQ